jgi:hypothetical protein
MRIGSLRHTLTSKIFWWIKYSGRYNGRLDEPGKRYFGFIVSLNWKCLGCDPEMLDTVFESITEVLRGNSTTRSRGKLTSVDETSEYRLCA